MEIQWQAVLGYSTPVEWTASRIRQLRQLGLCLSQDEFAQALGFTKRTIGNAERGAHPPSLALRRALDDALENASDAQRGLDPRPDRWAMGERIGIDKNRDNRSYESFS